MIDYRKARWQGFKVYHAAAMAVDEIDPASPMLKYIAEKLNLNIEEKFWLAWLYSACYSAPTAFFMLKNLPSSEKISSAEMKNWWRKNKNNLLFESDRRYVKNRNEFPRMFESYREYTKGGQLKTFLHLQQSDEQKTYDKIFYDVKEKLYYFSRYSVFTYLEAIYNLTKFPMQATGLNLREARTSRNGLCYALKKDDWVRISGKSACLSAKQFKYLQRQLEKLYAELISEYPHVPTTYWNLETSLCAWYKFFRAKRYFGYYIDRQMEEIIKMEKMNPRADFQLLWDFRREHFDAKFLGEVQGWRGIRKNLLNYFLETGEYYGTYKRL